MKDGGPGESIPDPRTGTHRWEGAWGSRALESSAGVWQVSGRCPAGVRQVADGGECTGSSCGEPCWVQLNTEVLKHWDFTLRHVESPCGLSWGLGLGHIVILILSGSKLDCMAPPAHAPSYVHLQRVSLLPMQTPSQTGHPALFGLILASLKSLCFPPLPLSEMGQFLLPLG